MCNAEGKFTGATVVDHIKPHKGDQGLFWDTDNWQGLCATHHSSVKQQVERSGYAGGCDESGLPLDDGHPWGGK
jgi:5-methylcytosine-specific restriction protein A